MNEEHTPQIVNFDDSALLSNIKAYEFVSSAFPSAHLRRIRRIEYVDEYYSLVSNQPLERLLVSGLNVTSQWSIDQITQEETIHLFRQKIDGNIDLKRMKSDIAHEIGHSVFFHLSDEQRASYQEIWKSATRRNRRDIRATNFLEEGFCQDYAIYFTDRQRLLQTDPEAYHFLQHIAEVC